MAKNKARKGAHHADSSMEAFSFPRSAPSGFPTSSLLPSFPANDRPEEESHPEPSQASKANAGGTSSNVLPVDSPPSSTASFPQVTPAEEPRVDAGSEVLIAYYGNKSNAIRRLREREVAYADIARALGIRYQHVKNVLERPLKRQIKAEREAAKNSNSSGSGK